MAKTVKCAFCGKEMVTGFFKGEDMALDLGDEYITCCAACHGHYALESKQERNRFKAKLSNYKKSNGKRKLTESELVALYNTYVTERQAYQQRSAQAGKLESLGYFYCNDAGAYYVAEFELGSVTSSRDMAKAIDHLEEPAICAFGGNDISCLEYRTVDKLGVDTGKALTTAYLFEIRLNDPRQMSYKPSVTYLVARGTAFLPHKRLQAAEECAMNALNILKRATGTSAKIVKVK